MFKDMIGPAHPDYNKRNKMNKSVIAFLGYARTGKDTAANIAVEEFGYTRFAFADKLRECLYALNPVVSTGHERLNDFDRKYRRLQDVISDFGWGGYKESKWGDEIRQLLQRMGTEVGRDLIDTDIWLKELDKVKADKIVITDCRFPNELEYIKRKGADTVRIWRPDFGPVNDHISEVAIDDFSANHEIFNKGTQAEFEDHIRAFLNNV